MLSAAELDKGLARLIPYQQLDGIAFGVDRETWPNPIVRWVELAYKLDVNEYCGQETVQLMIAHISPR